MVRRVALPPGVRRAAEFGLALVLLSLLGAIPAAVGADAPAETTAAAPSMAEPGIPAGFPNLAFLTPIEGLPTDALAARAFVASFRGAFTDEYFLTERADAGAAARGASEALTNRFHLAEGDAFGDEWQLRVTVLAWWGVGGAVPPPADTTVARRRGAGLRVAVSVLSAAAADAGERPVTTREDLTLEDPLEPRAEIFGRAGRTVALLAVESLHHRSGDLDADGRVQLDRTARTPVVERVVRPPAPLKPIVRREAVGIHGRTHPRPRGAHSVSQPAIRWIRVARRFAMGVTRLPPPTLRHHDPSRPGPITRGSPSRAWSCS